VTVPAPHVPQPRLSPLPTLREVELREQLQPDGPLFHAPRVRWLPRYARWVAALDVLLLVLAGTLALLLGVEPRSAVEVVPHVLATAAVVLAWWAGLALSRSYETRFLGEGTDEFRRVANTCLRVGAAVVSVAYAFALPVPRTYVAVLVCSGSALLLLGRFGARRVLLAGRRRGRWHYNVVLVGEAPAVRELGDVLHRQRLAGLNVVGVCLPDVDQPRLAFGDGSSALVVGSLDTVPGAASMTGADSVAVAPGMSTDALRRLAHDLEGTGVDLLVAPALTDVTGTRVSIRPMAGIPLLHVDEPELKGARRLLKSTFDRSVAAAALLTLAPLLLTVAVAVRLTSPGPAVFRQLRVGRDGATFTMYKFRSMRQDAEAQLPALAHLNEHEGPLFKVRQDPRVTPLGRWLRRYSVDELPQLVNVLLGQMSIVGPRPPLPTEVERYRGTETRRLLVKPGLTGLGQVSGRSDLSWDHSVRLDLQYVENWSLGLDLAVVARTFLSVARGRGAY
jgi:exopolysaccharide biosynthesis polyprenyl glycosylphosphotransferase